MGEFAKLFWTGRSQAVRLPKEFRFEGSEVRIWREGPRVYLAPLDESERRNTVAEAAADAIDRLRAQIQDGIESGDPEPLDMQAIKHEARRRFPPGE